MTDPPHIHDILKARKAELDKWPYGDLIQKCLVEIVILSMRLVSVFFHMTTGLPLRRMTTVVELPKMARTPRDVSIKVRVEYGSEILSHIYETKYSLSYLLGGGCSSVLTSYNSLYEYVFWLGCTLESMGVEVEITEPARSTIV